MTRKTIPMKSESFFPNITKPNNNTKSGFFMKKIVTSLFIVTLLAFTLNAQNQYSASTSTDTYTALVGGSVFTWTETTANDEGYTSATNIGFTFNYNGTAFTQFQASTNGFIRLGTGLAAATPADALAGLLRSIIAPLWDDLAVNSTASDITYQLSGVSPNQVLTIEWKNMKWTKTATLLSEFQVKLYEVDNHIEFIYGALNPNASASASIGLSDNTSITTTGSATGKFLSLNVGGIATARKYHQSMGYAFNGITAAPDANTLITFTRVATPTPISGNTYTIGGSSPTYNTLSEAAMALNLNGINGAIVLDVRSGTYDDIFHLIEVTGTSATNTITIKKESGIVTISPSNGSQSTTAPGASAGDAIFRLDGTDYVTVDGMNFTQNANNTSAAKKFNMGILVANSVLNSVPMSGSQNNIFKNISIDLGSGSLTAGLIGIRFGTAGTATGITFDKTNSFNTIQDVNITGFHANGIKMFGHSSAMPDSGNVITAVVGRNTLGNVTGSIGSDIRIIELDCESSVTIEKTDIVSVSNSAATTNSIYGIVTNLAGNTSLNRGKFIIRDNTITGINNGGSGVTTGLAGGMSLGATNNGTEYEIYRNKIDNIFSNASTTGRSTGVLINGATLTNLIVKFYNNMISDIRAPRCTSGPAVRGVDLQNGGGNGVFSIYNNSVYLNDATPPTATNHQSASMYIANMATGTVDFRNNILVNTMSTNGIGRAVGLYASSNANLLRLASTTNNNLYFIGTGGSTRGVSTDVANIYQTIATHKAAIASGGLGGPRDVNSISVDATGAFVSTSDLHINTTNWILNGQGAPTTLVTSDFDGNLRSTSLVNGPVDIGADEYTPSGNAITIVTGTIGDGSTSIFTGVDGKVTGEITWHLGTGTLPSAIELNYTPGEQVSSTTYPSINRTYTINATGGSAGWDADVKLYYNWSTELRGFVESGMRINRFESPSWVVLANSIDATNHFGQTNVTGFSVFTFGENDNPLPVELVNFTGKAKSRNVNLNWETKTETDNSGFEVERKDKNGDWNKIGFVEGSGSSNSPKYYSFEDKKLSSGKHSYRLKQLDNDGTTSYSDEVEVTIDVPTEFAMSQNYPNPFNPSTKVDYQLAMDAKVTIELYSITGEKVVTLLSQELEAGYYSMMIDSYTHNMASGIYIYRMIATDALGKSFVSTKKLSLIK